MTKPGLYLRVVPAVPTDLHTRIIDNRKQAIDLLVDGERAQQSLPVLVQNPYHSFCELAADQELHTQVEKADL